MKIKHLFVIFFFLMGPILAYDIDAGRRIGMGGTVILSSPMGDLTAEMGFERRFDLSELDRYYAIIGYRYKNVTGAIGFSQFGESNYYTEKLLKATAAIRLRMFTGGLLVGCKMIDIGNGYGSFRAGSVGLMGGMDCRKLHLGFVADNINQPKLADNAEPDKAVFSLYGEIEGPSIYSITCRAEFREFEKPAMSIGQYIRLIGKNAIFWGITGNPMTYGGGIEMCKSGLIINYAVSYHPVLGLRHNISLGFGRPN
ncbi:MAG: hypothetical protein NTV06_01515 [candidate division Zixibacteria bacterium]|nr:hypothetical protein [candidate division Zixibacteria bacterium]